MQMPFARFWRTWDLRRTRRMPLTLVMIKMFVLFPCRDSPLYLHPHIERAIKEREEREVGKEGEKGEKSKEQQSVDHFLRRHVFICYLRRQLFLYSFNF